MTFSLGLHGKSNCNVQKKPPPKKKTVVTACFCFSQSSMAFFWANSRLWRAAWRNQRCQPSCGTGIAGPPLSAWLLQLLFFASAPCQLGLPGKSCSIYQCQSQYLQMRLLTPKQFAEAQVSGIQWDLVAWVMVLPHRDLSQCSLGIPFLTPPEQLGDHRADLEDALLTSCSLNLVDPFSCQDIKAPKGPKKAFHRLSWFHCQPVPPPPPSE